MASQPWEGHGRGNEKTNYKLFTAQHNLKQIKYFHYVRVDFSAPLYVRHWDLDQTRFLYCLWSNPCNVKPAYKLPRRSFWIDWIELNCFIHAARHIRWAATIRNMQSFTNIIKSHFENNQRKILMKIKELILVTLSILDSYKYIG